MCGIAGLAVARPPNASFDLRRRIEAMSSAMVARGPDDSGAYVSPDGRLGLGNQRLAVRDLTPAGHMPMANVSGSVWITYNGEIYNGAELRAELEACGCVFRSHSDTEIILAGYEAWGESVVEHLRGMFAFAIYDRRALPKLLLARDPLGIKPLYYSASPGSFLFASECKGLHASGLVSKDINPRGLVTYLELGSVPAPLSIFREIQALQAGHTLLVDLHSGVIHQRASVEYWRLPAASRAPRIPYPDAVGQVKSVLLDAVRRHMVSDVPLGAFLSGGVDSSGIVALMREASPSAVIRTCSVSFAESGYSETPYAHAVAERFETEHADIRVSAADLVLDLDCVLESLDQPSVDGVNTYFVSRAARRSNLTVALSGIGGDELFGGYPSTRRLATLLPLLKLTRAVPGGPRAAAAILGRYGDHDPRARLGGWLGSNGAAPAAAYLGLRGLFSPALIDRLVRPEVLHDANGTFDLVGSIERAAQGSCDATAADLAKRYELSCYMRHQLLRDTDVMSMAHSLEVRTPFVDVRVVEQLLALRVGPHPRGLPKQLLRDAIASLPPSVAARSDKQGFTFPFDAWLRGPVRPLLSELVGSVAQHFSEYLRPKACANVLRAFDEGRSHWSGVWALAALQSAAMTSHCPGRST